MGGLFSGGLIYLLLIFFFGRGGGLLSEFYGRLDFTIKQFKHGDNSLKHLKTSNPDSPWAYIREGLLSEGYLRLRFWEAGRGLFSGELSFERAYYRSFTVFYSSCEVVSGMVVF